MRHDNAADGAYSFAWSSTTNGGTGFEAWQLFRSIPNDSMTGWFLGSSGNNGPATSLTNIDTSGRSFGLYANGNDGVSDGLSIAWRAFAGAPLSIGDTFTVLLDTGYVEPPEGRVGFAFPGEVIDAGHIWSVLPGPTTRFAFVFEGGLYNYEWYASGVYHDTGVALAYGGLKVAFTLTGAETFELRINDGAPQSGTLGGAAGTQLAGVAFFNYIAGSGPPHDLFFNSLQVCHP